MAERLLSFLSATTRRLARREDRHPVSSRRESRRVIIAGMPRTGTSWVAKILAQDPTITYYREPDNADHVASAKDYFARLYLPRDGEDAGYRMFIERALAGKIATPYTMSEDPGPLMSQFPRRLRGLGARFPILYMRRSGILVKLVRSNLALSWLEQHFPDTRQIYLVRHPCAQFASWKRMGWIPEPELFLQNDALVRNHLAPFAPMIEDASDYWEKAGALWGLVNYVVYRERRPGGMPLIVQHEWLCKDPIPRFEWLYDRLDLRWTASAEGLLRDYGQKDGGPYSLFRRSEEVADRWRTEVSKRDVCACRRFVEPFDLPFTPDFHTTLSPPQQ